MSPQQTIAHYLITAKLGEGGMGEVWRATDSKLGREVAIKILPEAFARDPGRMARFEREAKVLASLNHPHIAQIYGVEERALIMELVEGESPKGSLSFEDAWKIALQIAEALEYAHQRGVIHRDLKPANVKVTPDGKVKLLDFGLAKAFNETGDYSASDPENAPTVTIGGTVGGAILGTAAYMAPEQAKGKRVDKRCDIWAWGVVLYELLTGKRLFGGETTAETVAQVLTNEPDLKLVPRQVRKLLGRCLEKDPMRRLRDIGDAADLLEEAAFGDGTERQWIRVTPWIVATLASALAAVAFWVPWRTNRPILEDVFRVTMETAPAERLGPELFCCRPSYTSVALSPDGKTAVFSGVSGSPSSPQVQLYKRTLDQPNAIPLAGTAGASQPFFSPDGQWVGFSAGGKLKKVPLAGGPPLAICDVQDDGFHILWGASWSSAGKIVFAVNSNGTDLMEVPAAGGTPMVLATSSPESLYSTPNFLPDGKTLLLTVRRSDWESAEIVTRLDTGEQRVLLKGGADARYVPTGHLVYLQSGVLMAVPFDSRRRQLTGPPVALLDGVMQSINMPNTGWESGMGQFAISASGNLLYASGGVAPLEAETIERVDRKGIEADLNAPKGKDYVGPRVSPDGSSLALQVINTGATSDIWVIDTNTGTDTRLTSQGKNVFPLWSPDGKRILFGNGAGITRLLSLPADGSGAAEPVMSAQTQIAAASWPGQRLPLVYLLDSRDHSEIWMRPLSGGGEPKRFRETEFSLTDADLSPDGHWMAYHSKESGTGEIYLQGFSGPGEKHRISTAGGINPAWARNGRELFYLAPRGSGKFAMMAVDVAIGGAFHAGTPHVLFEGQFRVSYPLRSYDVTPDGQHFIMLRTEKILEEHVSKLNLVLHWSEELKRRVAANEQ